MHLPLSRLTPASTLTSREPARSSPVRTVTGSELRDAEAFLDGVEVSDSTWGEWEQCAMAKGDVHA